VGEDPHTVLPLAGVTHMAAQEKAGENLLVLEADFLKRALGGGRAAGPHPPKTGRHPVTVLSRHA
jgi:hypothetical protein